MDTITVEQALRRGHKMITYPVLAVLIIAIALTFLNGEMKVVPFYISLISVLVLPWLCWSIMITRWKLWAYSNVRNVHELKERALKEIYTPKPGGFSEKTEIRFPGDQLAWDQLQLKFQQADVFMDDYSLQHETSIYYSKGKNLFQMLIMLVLFASGVVLIVLESYMLGFFAAALGGYVAYMQFKDATNPAPQIIISNEGMQTAYTVFYPWKDIKDEEVIVKYANKKTNRYLSYTYPGGEVYLLINGFAIDRIRLETMMRIYRSRAEKNARNV